VFAGVNTFAAIADGSARPQLQPLIDAAWQCYDTLKNEPYIVTPSIPILFFGDSERYWRSSPKIITVGLNPSQREFPPSEPFQRFRTAANITPQNLASQQATDYLVALNTYFRNDPYRLWFGAFEPILNGLDASYYDGHTNAALNTDLCSPLATAPTWSGLTAIQQTKLMETGVELWHQLVAQLQPDIVIMSIAQHHLGRLRFTLDAPLRIIYTLERRIDGSTKRMPYHVYATNMGIAANHRALLIWGRAAHTPFGLVSMAAKREIGSRIGEVWRNQAQVTTGKHITL
jgi:hypothetical protein